MKIAALAILFLVCASTALHAQAPASGMPILAEQRQAYNQIKGNFIRMAEKMPAENYDYKPVPEIRSFGELMAHVAAAQTLTCGFLNTGQPKTPDAATKKTKDEIVAALKASFDECDKAWDGTTEANAMQMMNMGGRDQSSRLGILSRFTTIHDNEEYGYGALYLRTKGLVPPTSDAAGRGGR